MSRLVRNTPWPLHPPVAQHHVEAEVANCVGGVKSPLLANIALNVLDAHFVAAWAAMGDSSARHRRRRRGEATYRLVRYADDFVVLVHGTRDHAEALRDKAAGVLAPMGLALSVEKTRICHIDDGFDFLGFRIQRQPKRGSGKLTVYTWPTKKALCTVKAKVRTATRQGLHQPLAVLLYRLGPILRGWTTYFQHGVSKATFDYLRRFTWRRVMRWLRRKYPKATWNWIRRRHLPGWWPTDGDVVMFDPGKVTVSRYRYRAANIATPWSTATAA
jgi:RNA-directed DNA polymerase